MLESVKISRRQSEIRQELAVLVGKTQPDENEVRSMESLDAEYRSNEVRFRGALIAEDAERRDAGKELETRGGREWSDLIGKFEIRQVALALDEGAALSGPTSEVVEELRSKAGFRGVPLPWAALETRAGETVSTGAPDPISTRPIIDRLFPDSVAGKMGAQMITVDSGATEWPVTTSSVAAAWAASETGAVGSPAAFATADKALKPDSTLGIQMRITRKALKQTGAALEQAVRRDMNSAISTAMDRAVFLGAGSSGEPSGVLVGSYGITSTSVAAAASWAEFRAAVTRFLLANAAGGAGSVRLLCRPEVWSAMDGALISGTAVSEWDRLTANISSVVLSTNALAAPSGSPAASTALLTTSAGGVAPVFVGTWGAIDLVRDPYSDAASGGLRLTALATMDVTIARASQLQILTGIQ